MIIIPPFIIYPFLIGRFLFSLIFIFSGLTQLWNYRATVKYMQSLNVPLPKFSTLSSSVVSVVGGIATIFHATSLYGSILIILFLIPSTYFGHRFWAISDKDEKANQMQHFMKNISMIGGAVIIAMTSLLGE